MECTNVLKRSQHRLTSIIRSSAHRHFNVNNERLLVVTKCSIALFKFRVVTSRIPKYLKVCTRSITSPLNTNFWHGSIELNTMTFVFFTFTVSPCSAHNCWSTSNYCYSPTFDFDVKWGHLQKTTTKHAHLLGLVHHIFCRRNAPPRHLNIAQTVRGWEDNLASHLAITWSWRWHLRLGGWCVQYPYHTSPAGIARSVPPPRG